MTAQRRKTLSPELTAELIQLATDIAAGEQRDSALDNALAGLAALPPGVVARASVEIAEALRAAVPRFQWPERRPVPFRSPEAKAQEALWDDAHRRWVATLRTWAADLLKHDPRVAWLLFFHHSGHVREVALDAIGEPPASALFFAALAWRLNDWVQQVRDAARRCAERVLTRTDADVSAQAALVLLERRTAWGRWQGEEAALDAVFSRRDVIAIMARVLRDAPVGRHARCFRCALRYEAIDRHLPALASEAVQPAVRAVAYSALLAGKASWTIGYGWIWVDKSLGVRKRVPTMASRSLADLPSRGDLIRRGIDDTSAKIRVLAADALVTDRAFVLGSGALIQRLALDKSAAVRSRADFMRRHPLPRP